jgi:hypothetical protein
MTETTSERPLTVATLESILEQLGKNLRLLNAAENQAALARGNRYRFIPSHSEKPERQAQIDAAQAEVDRFEKLVATLLKKSQGCARQLNRQTVIVTGPLIKEHRFWSGGIPGLIGSGHYETETYEIFVRDLKGVIRVEIKQPSLVCSDLEVSIDHDGEPGTFDPFDKAITLEFVPTPATT